MAATELSFDTPPINEVVAGVSFDSLGTDGVALLAGFWRDIARDTFPDFQVQPPYTGAVEQFGNGSGPSLVSGLQMIAGYPAPRFWAVGDKGQYLLQLQPDWFACNWRRVGADDQYYKWPRRRADFEAWYKKLSDYVGRYSDHALTPTQCEVSYINHIAPSQHFRGHADYANVFNVRFGELPLSNETFSAALSYAVPEADSVGAAARLYVQIDTALSARGQQIYVMQITLRGAPGDRTVEGIMDFLDLGRKVIGDAFVGLTTADIQRDWGRSDV